MEEGGGRRGREEGEGGGGGRRGRRREEGSFIPGSQFNKPLTWAQSTMARLPITHAQINTETQKRS